MKVPNTRCDTRNYDGCLVDANGRTYPATSDPSELEALGNPQDKLAFFVNGINCDIARQLGDMARLKSENFRLVGIHNATAGVVRDLAQCLADKFNFGHNEAVITVKSLLMSAVASGKQLTFFAHSQGALICSRALEETCRELHQNGLDDVQIQHRLSNIEINTIGGASYTYPDGPKYHHKINLLDPVAVMTGLGGDFPGVHPGQGAQTEEIKRFVPPSQAPAPPSDTLVKVSLLDKTVHGVSVYYKSP
jgi:hypothetical protein